MDFTLSKEHEMARQLFKEFAENEVKPLAQEVDETETFPRETVEKMAKYGFMGIPVPKEYGGQGCDTLTYAMCVEELSKVCATTGVIVSAHTSLCIDPIMTFGTEDQKKKYVPDLASGRKIGAFGLTEPGAGTDAQGQQTKAVLDGDEWVINGSKCFITNGKEADVYIVIAVTGIVEKRGRKMKEISSFIVEKGTPGFTFGTKEKNMINEAAFIKMEGVSDIAGIDAAMKLGANHPMGPLELGDFVGLDICLAIMDVLYNETGDSKYRACPLIRKMVRGGNLGVKTGKGFYVYNADRTKTPVDAQ
jgi:alkylation response protein AidB-like acyl-CoA dehydrogenase